MAEKSLQQWSANSTAYFELWKKTLHQNCKGKKECSCHEGAYRLTIARLDCIERGMPDLHPDDERRIWETAFEIHQVACHDLPGRRPGSISPTWSKPTELSDTVVCDCFEKAYQLDEFVRNYEIERIFKYDPFSEEREI